MTLIGPALRNSFWAAALTLALASGVAAQGMQIGLGGLRQSGDTPVEVTAEQFQIDQASGGARFEGNVLVVQGDMRLSASKIDVEYDPESRAIRRLIATGQVLLATPSDAAESQSATYEIGSGQLVMTGSVLLTQGGVTIAGDKLSADLRQGTGRMDGNVKTVFQPGAKN